jgi:plasmid stabilization system protein ParE
MRPRILPEAEADLLEAALWYEDQRQDLGGEFLDQALSTFAAIGKNPLRFPLYEASDNPRQLRRALLNRFPYVVLYEILPEIVRIVAIAHASRRPEYWKFRQ